LAVVLAAVVAEIGLSVVMAAVVVVAEISLAVVLGLVRLLGLGKIVTRR